MTVLAFLTERAVVKKILEHLGLPATGPPKAPARGAAQLELDERPADELRDELPNYDSWGRPGALKVLVRLAPGCGRCRAAWTGVVSVRHGMLRRRKEGS